MVQSKRSGGPKTPEGKTKSSQNALKLGATTMNFANTSEQHMVDEYVQELTNYYKPQSPLEKLQIGRIAICRAKLARLYQVEQVRLQLAQTRIENNPEQILKEMGVNKGLVRAMALEGLRLGSITLPCNLSLSALEGIAKEVDRFHGKLQSEADLRESFPTLIKFLHQYAAKGLGQSTSLLERFEVVVRRIYKMMRSDIYFGILGELFDEQLRIEKQQSLQENKDVTELMQVLDPNYITPEPVQAAIDLRQLQTLLPLFVYLKKALEDAQDLIVRYNSAKALLIQSTLLPQADADLLMRYQTTLERRLSSSVGELLELQKRR